MALQPFTYLSAMAVFFVTIFPAALVALPFNEVKRTRLNAPFWRAFSRFIIHYSTLSKVYTRDEREPEKKTHPEGLFIANHQSFMDIPLVISELPIPPIMKKEVLYIPILGLCGYSAGAMIVDRKNMNSRRKVLELAKKRLTSSTKALMFYPEGTRNRESMEPKNFEDIKKPILKFAYQENIPVHSVSLYGTQKVLNPSSFLIRHGEKIGMIIRKAKMPSDYQDEESFLKDCWDDVKSGYKELQEKLT